MKKFLFVLMCIVFAQLTSADVGSTGNRFFKTTLYLGRSSLLPYEPLDTVTKFENVSTQAQTVRSNWTLAILFRIGNAHWQTNSNSKVVTFIAPTEHNFKPNEQVTIFKEVSAQDGQGHAFPVSGTYSLKSLFADTESDVINLKVEQPIGQDQAAFEALGKVPLYHYFSDSSAFEFIEIARPEISKQKYEDLDQEFGKFINQFPQSRYAQWARMGRLLAKAAGIKELHTTDDVIRDIARQNEKLLPWLEERYGKETVTRILASKPTDNAVAYLSVQQGLEKLAPQLSVPVNARCWLAAGRIAQIRRDVASAKADYDKAIATQAETTLKDEVEIRLKSSFP